MKPVTITVVAVSDLNEFCEISADVVEHAVKYYLDVVFVQLFAKCGKISVCAESAVYFCIVNSIISVCYRLEHRSEIYSVEAHFLYMRNSVLYLFKSVFGVLRIIVCLGATAESERINVIYRKICEIAHFEISLIYFTHP